MNSERFFQLLSKPSSSDENDILLLENLIEEYPYFQAAHVMLICALYKNKHISYKDKLKSCAALTYDRSLLYWLINEIENDTTESNKNIDIKYEVTALTSKTEEDNYISDIMDDKQDNKPVYSEEIPVLNENAERDINIADVDDNKVEKDKKKELIDKFLINPPKISPPLKVDFFNPVNLAQKSCEEHEDFLTETFAVLYLRKGNYNKAIQIYEKLSLKFPEKSSYFANQIEKIKQEQNKN